MPVSRETSERDADAVVAASMRAIEQIMNDLIHAGAKPSAYLTTVENVAYNVILSVIAAPVTESAVRTFTRRLTERCMSPHGTTSTDPFVDDEEERERERKVELHNRVAAYAATYIVREMVKGGASDTELMTVLESVAAGVMSGIVKLGGAAPVSEAFAANVCERLSNMQMARAPTQGTA